MKAIHITSENRPSLAARFNVEELDYDEVLPIGYWLVCDFGNNGEIPFETLLPVDFNAMYTIHKEIENGWVAI